MKIEAQDDFRIAVELSGEDMVELDITYDELDYANIETRRVLWTLLDEARQTLGRDINLSEKMLIEAVPSKKGGCTIYFTVLPKSEENRSGKLLYKQNILPVMCEFSDVNGVIDLSRQLAVKSKRTKSELYSDGDKFRLIVFPESEQSQKIELIALEFGKVFGSSQCIVSHTREHWKKLAGPYAVSQIGSY